MLCSIKTYCESWGTVATSEAIEVAYNEFGLVPRLYDTDAASTASSESTAGRVRSRASMLQLFLTSFEETAKGLCCLPNGELPLDLIRAQRHDKKRKRRAPEEAE